MLIALAGGLDVAQGDRRLAGRGTFDGSSTNTNNRAFDPGNDCGDWGNNDFELGF